MYKRIAGVLVVTSSLLAAPFFASPAVAEATDAPPPVRTVEESDDGFDLGWLGLIGLIGLAGLMRRDRDRHHVDRPVGTTVGPTGTTRGTTTRTP